MACGIGVGGAAAARLRERPGAQLLGELGRGVPVVEGDVDVQLLRRS